MSHAPDSHSNDFGTIVSYHTFEIPVRGYPDFSGANVELMGFSMIGCGSGIGGVGYEHIRGRGQVTCQPGPEYHGGVCC